MVRLLKTDGFSVSDTLWVTVDSSSFEVTAIRRGTTSASRMMSTHVSSGTITGSVATPPIIVLGLSWSRIDFRAENEPVRFEKYLKFGSGRAFAKRHFAGTN